MISKRFVFGTVAVLGIGLVLGGTIGVVGEHLTQDPSQRPSARIANLAEIVPAPVAADPRGNPFTVMADTAIRVPLDGTADSPAVKAIGDYLAALLRPATGYAVPVGPGAYGNGNIQLTLSGHDPRLGAEGYALDIASDQITVIANQPSGLFYGVQTLRQLLPPQVEKHTALDAPLMVPSGYIVDYPRYTYRAAGLDVARHFFSVADVERYIDDVSLYKINYLHLHLTDDQGWRLAIDGWPNLTTVGAATEVGGGAGGFYTQDDYRKLVAYARSRYITIVPEIDVPGHVTAALASYPDLSCDGKPQQVFTGITGGFSSLCASKQTTYTFIDDVFRQLAALTPGPYVGIGGDEAQATSASDYAKIVDHAASAVRAAGKVPWGWEETVAASVGTPAVATHWNTGAPAPALTQAANSGTRLVLDPANHTYLDQKYNAGTRLGLHWAGYVDVQDAYEWNPETYLPGVNASAVLGVEADLWTETIQTNFDIDYMVFPRLPAVAELGWSPSTADNWSAFQKRLAAQGPRWSAMGIKYYRSTQIPWPSGS